MIYTLKDRKFFSDSEYVYIMTHKRPSEVKFRSNRRIKVKLGDLVEMYPTCICIDSKFRQEFRFDIIKGQFGSSGVKLRSNLGQTRRIRVKLGR